MMELLHRLSLLPTPIIWLLFLVENLLLTAAALLAGHAILVATGRPQKQNPTHPRYNRREWAICGLTNVLNTVVTYAGFWLYQQHIIVITTGTKALGIITDFIGIFLAMDLLMYLFHWFIHHTFLYKAIHQLHHEAIDPKPIDLFILHPIETLSFGGLWIGLLILYPFNIYAILIYLTVNLVFGLAGHLGIEPLPAKTRNSKMMKYLGTSSFHHQHHRDVHHNFGFYTSLWDRLFGTYQ